MQFFKNLYSKNNENTKLIDIFEKNEYLKPICDEIKKIGFSKLYDYTIKIIKQLVSKSLNLQKLLKRIKQGLPDEIPSLRSLVWKIILLYLPREIDQWNDSLEKSRNKYFELRKEVYDNLIKNEKICSVELDSFNISIPLQRYKSEQISLKNNEDLDIEIFREVDKNYHFSNNKIYLKLYSFMKTHSNEISVNSKKAIQSYLQDCEILNQINKDIRRTKINMHFLFTPSIGNNSLNNDNISKIAANIRSNSLIKDENNSNIFYETHIDVLERILFVFVKTTKYPYSQGMNDLIIALYYCFFNDNSVNFKGFRENDTYFCFLSLMSKIGEIYELKETRDDNMINIQLKKLNQYLKHLDQDIFNHFQREKVELELFCVRWYRSFLCQEFDLPQVLNVWDILLRQKNYSDYMNCLCIAILKIKKNEIIKLKLCQINKILKKVGEIDIQNLIKVTKEVKKKYKKIKEKVKF